MTRKVTYQQLSKGKKMKFNYTIKKAVRGEKGLIDVPHSIDLTTETSADWAVEKGFVKFADMTLAPEIKIGCRLTYQPYMESKSWTKKRNMLYVVCIDGKMVKIGMTTTGLAQRWSSYNNGTPAIREGKGSGSTTNYDVVQPLIIAMEEGRKVEWYCYPTPVKEYKISAWGHQDRITSKDVSWYESKLLDIYKNEFGHKPHFSQNG
jgi:hypothetical protein